MFIAPRMIPYFQAIWGVRRVEEQRRLSRPAQAILRVLRREWEMATADLRDDAGVSGPGGVHAGARRAAGRDARRAERGPLSAELHLLWTLGIGRFPDELRRRVSRDVALREIARCFLTGAGMTVPGELARVTGLSRADAGLGNRALVAEGSAEMLGRGLYRLSSLPGPSGAPAPGAPEQEDSPDREARADAATGSMHRARRRRP